MNFVKSSTPPPSIVPTSSFVATRVPPIEGTDIPSIALGTYPCSKDDTEQAIKYAIDIGYKYIDCASINKNEHVIGTALREIMLSGKIDRENLFVSSKLWNNVQDYTSVPPILSRTLRSLRLNFLDLYLIHWPMGFTETTDYFPKTNDPHIYTDTDYLEIWKGMEECVTRGLTRRIGLCNFNSFQVERVLKNCAIRPSVVQIEINPNFAQREMIRFCKERNITVIGYRTLGGNSKPFTPTQTMYHPKLIEIAKKHGKSPAQIVLNYVRSLGVGVIAKSVVKARILENLNIFDFKLDQSDVQTIESLSKNCRVENFDYLNDHQYYPFNAYY